MKIAVILPSRGLIFSQTADELLQNLQGFDYDIFFSHSRPIPDCFERPLKQALNGSYTHIWFVEDDMILPERTLETMLFMDAPVVTCDYPVNKKGQGAVFQSKEGKVIFTGTGCLLVKRAVFDKLKPPYFRTDVRWSPTNHGKFIRFTAKVVTNPGLEGYGLHDVNFGMKLLQAGIPISVTDTIGQRKLIRLGKVGSNNGAHVIEEWTTVKPDYLFKQFKKAPVIPIGKLIEVTTVTGGLMVHPDKAKKMVAAGMAAMPPQESIVVDYNEVDL